MTLISGNVDEKFLAECHSDSMTTLRALVEKLSTSEGKTISWKTLSSLVGPQDIAHLDSLGDCITDGCRIIRVSDGRAWRGKILS